MMTEEQIAELEALHKECKPFTKFVSVEIRLFEECLNEIKRLREFEKDAMRYRWLRNQNVDEPCGYFIAREVSREPGSGYFLSEDDADIEIDAAMQEAPQ